MVTRVVQYTDLDGNAVEKTLMFNINKMDKIRFGNKHPHMEEEVKAISDAAQKAETEEEKVAVLEKVIEFVDDIVTFAYGVRRGNKFERKTEDIVEFLDSEEHDEFIADLLLDIKNFYSFMTELFPDVDFSEANM